PIVPSLVSGISGETAEQLQEHLVSAREFAAAEADYHSDPEWQETRRGAKLVFLGLILGWPLVWTLWVFVTEGGLVFRFSGLCLVNRRGQSASRLRCAGRALLIWLPVAGLLVAAVWLEDWHWNTWQQGDHHVWAPWLFVAAWWGALALVLSYAVVA